MAFEDALAGLPSLGQPYARLPRRGPSWASVRRIVAVLHGDRSDRCDRSTQEVLQGAPLRTVLSSAFVCWPEKASTQIGDSAGKENQVIVANLSNLSNMAAREQGVKVIKERQISSPIDILMKMQSSGNLPDFVSGIVKDFIQAPIVQKSVIEKPTNNPCKDLPICDVVGQDTVRPSQAEIVEPNSPCKYTKINSSTSTLGGWGNKTKAKASVAPQSVWLVL